MRNFLDSLEEISNNFQDWIVENQSNPVLWVGLLVAGMAIFYVTYNALQKEKN